MRVILTIPAFCCLLFLTGGYRVLYKCRLAEIKTAVKKELRGLRRSELTQLEFSAAEEGRLEWEDESEFRYRGEMYDVVEIERRGDRVVYHCLADTKETALLDAFQKTQDPFGKNTSRSLLKLLTTPFLPAAVITAIPPPGLKLCPAANYFSSLLDTFRSVQGPPPKVC